MQVIVSLAKAITASAKKRAEESKKECETVIIPPEVTTELHYNSRFIQYDDKCKCEHSYYTPTVHHCDYYIPRIFNIDLSNMNFISKTLPDDIEFIKGYEYTIAVDQDLNYKNRRISTYNNGHFEIREYFNRSNIDHKDVILVDVRIPTSAYVSKRSFYDIKTTEMVCFNPRFVTDDVKYSPFAWYMYYCRGIDDDENYYEKDSERNFAKIIYEFNTNKMKPISGHSLVFYWELCTIVPVLGFITDELPEYFVDEVITYYPRNVLSISPEKQTLEFMEKYYRSATIYFHSCPDSIIEKYICKDRHRVKAFSELPAKFQTKSICEFIAKDYKFFVSRSIIKATDSIFEDELKARDPTYEKLLIVKSIIEVKRGYSDIHCDNGRDIIEFVLTNWRLPENDERKRQIQPKFYLDRVKIAPVGDWLKIEADERTLFDIIERKVTNISDIPDIHYLYNLIQNGYTLYGDVQSPVFSLLVEAYKHDPNSPIIRIIADHCGIQMESIENCTEIRYHNLSKKFNEFWGRVLFAKRGYDVEDLHKLYTILDSNFIEWTSTARVNPSGYDCDCDSDSDCNCDSDCDCDRRSYGYSD